MKKFFLCIAVAVFLFSILFIWKKSQPEPGSREAYEAFLDDHEYKEALQEGEGEEEEESERPDRPDLAFMQNFLRTMDPNLKRPVPETLMDLYKYTALVRDKKLTNARTKATTLADLTEWNERGPVQVGGRTRAMLFDPADPAKKKVWAGGVSGGLWYNDDITNASSPWEKVDDLWDNLSISCIASDPNNQSIMYVGTGESHTGMRGGGVWKTTDGGVSWTRLTSTGNFYQIRDIGVRNEGGTSAVYVAVHLDYADDNPPDNAGLYRSVNGGTSWAQVLPVAEFGQPSTPTDIEFGDDEIWVGTKPTYGNSSINSRIYKSTTGTTGWSFFDTNTSGQIELGVSQSTPDVVYAILEQDGAVENIIRSTNNGTNWFIVNKPIDADDGIPVDDYTRGQAWYDLTIAINPTNSNEVIVGGIDLFKTTNGGSSWSQLSKWWDGVPTTAPVVHADQHEILYRPGFPGEAIFGNDGGVYYSNNLSAGTSSANAFVRNLNYNVTQFYTGALHPTLPNYMLGGTQDNGTQRFTLEGFANTTEAYGGDGAMCFIDQLDPTIQIVSYIYNDISISKNGGVTFEQLMLDYETGHFINIGEYDSQHKILYTAKNTSSVYKVKVNVASPVEQTLSIPGLGSMATALRVSPHTTSQSNLFVGTEAGRLFKVANAGSNSPVISEITGTGFPNGSISGIAFGANESQILVTFSNYGIVSVWETRNGGGSWQNKEGNLQNMPVRWVEYHPHNSDQAFIATEVGVWSTDDINVASPVWNATNGGLANVRTDMLRIRKSDGIMMASTHGRGVFTATIPSQLPQSITFGELSTKTFNDPDFQLSASSTSELEVSFISSNPAIAEVNGDMVKIKGAGTVTISAVQEGNAYFKAANPVDRILTINKDTQAIAFDDPGEVGVNIPSVELTATSGSGLAVTFTSSNPLVATVAGNVVAIVGVGTSTITAQQSGNSNYLQAPDVQRTLTVVSRIITLTGDLNFGEVIIGESTSRELVISNTGTAQLDITNVTIPEGYSVDAEQVDGNIVATITFTPDAAKAYNGEIVIESNATSGTSSMAITGTGVPITDVEIIDSDLLELFPNPVEDWLTIRGSDFKEVKALTIVDEKGSTTEFSPEVHQDELRVNVSRLSSGIYILAIPLGGKLYQKKFTKK